MKANPSPIQPSDPQTEPFPSPSPVMVVREPLKVLFTWKSKNRPFKKRTREFYSTAGSIIFLVCVILLFIKEFLAIVVLISFAFLIYVLGTIEPENVEHKITSRGLWTSGRTFFWETLGRFWFEQKWTDRVLFIEHFAGLPSRLMLLINSQDESKIKDLLSNHLLFEKPELTQMEKAGDWLQKKVPLESGSRTVLPPTVASKK